MSHFESDSLAAQLRAEQARRSTRRIEVTQALLSAVELLAQSGRFADAKVNLIATQVYAALAGGQIIVVVYPHSTQFEQALIYTNFCRVETQVFPALVVGDEFPAQLSTAGVNGLHQIYQMLTHILSMLKGLDPREHEDVRSVARESGRFYRTYFASHPEEVPTAADREIMSY